jgi:hypothetical protein
MSHNVRRAWSQPLLRTCMHGLGVAGSGTT